MGVGARCDHLQRQISQIRYRRIVPVAKSCDRLPCAKLVLVTRAGFDWNCRPDRANAIAALRSAMPAS